jgi:hypothetical protein
VASRSSTRIAERGALNPSPDAQAHSTGTPRRATRIKPPRRDFSIFSLDSDCSLPPVAEISAAVGKALPPTAIDKINAHLRKLSKVCNFMINSLSTL